MHLRMFWTILVSIGLSHCAIIQPPSDTEAIAGNTVELKCAISSNQATNFTVEWKHTSVQGHSERINRQYTILSPRDKRFSIEGNLNAGEYNLVIRNVTLDDAGKYTCVDQYQHAAQADAQLIVFDSYPSPEHCSANIAADGAVGLNSCGIEPDVVELTCVMNYQGSLTPGMYWTSSEGQQRFDRELSAGHQITSNFSVKADEIAFNSNFTCHVKYVGSVLKSNISWTTTVNVFSNRTRFVNVSKSEQPNVVDCAFLTRHHCSYVWRKVHPQQENVHYGSTLNAKDLPDGLYVCQANCTVRGRICLVQPVELNVHGSESEPPAPGPGPVTAVIVTIIIVIIIATVVLGLTLYFRPQIKTSLPCFTNKQPVSANIEAQTPGAADPLMNEETPGSNEGATESKENEEEKAEDPAAVLLEPAVEQKSEDDDGGPEVKVEEVEEVEEEKVNEPETVEQPEGKQDSEHLNPPANAEPVVQDSDSDIEDIEKSFVWVDKRPDGIVEHVRHQYPR